MAGNWDIEPVKTIFTKSQEVIAMGAKEMDPLDRQSYMLQSIATSLYGFGYLMIASEADERRRRDPVFTREYFVTDGSREFKAESEEAARDLANRLVDEGHFKSAEELVVKCREVAKYSAEVVATSAEWRDASEEAGDRPEPDPLIF